MKSRVALLSVTVALLATCTQETIPVPARALSRSGRSTFICLGPAGDAPGLPMTDCTTRRASSLDDFEDDDGNALPHVYALVTQTTRGEIAVIDMTTQTGQTSPILDQDPGVPGANFLPVGAQPVDVVATPGGTAAFVTVAEPGREGIFALPAWQLRPREGCAEAEEEQDAGAAQGRWSPCTPPSLSAWPACALWSRPGDILVVSDPEGQDPDGQPAERHACDAEYGAPDPEPAHPNGDLSAEGLGRQKLVVALPDAGGIVVIDAQRLLNRSAGSFDECPIEGWLPLEASLPSAPPAEAPPSGEGCVAPAAAPAAQPIAKPQPAGLAVAGSRLFVADLGAPVIHQISLQTPCAPRELPPLLPRAADEPGRIVTTSRIAVSTVATSDFRRFLYAVDADDGSVMAFDISDGVTGRTPLVREHPEWNPFLPSDRIRFNAPVRDLAIVQRDVASRLDTTGEGGGDAKDTGVAPAGIRCDPTPCEDPDVPNDETTSCVLQSDYRPSSDGLTGPSPARLRGTFGFMMLASGQVAVVDIDDLDADCRAPNAGAYSAGAGCRSAPGDDDGDGILDGSDACRGTPNGVEDAAQTACTFETTGEASCNVVLPHATRSESFLRTGGASARRLPGLQARPFLYDSNNALLNFEDVATPRMRATLPPSVDKIDLAVGTSEVPLLPKGTNGGLLDLSGAPWFGLAMNLEDPRAHVADQAWIVTYEGTLAGFSQIFMSFDEQRDETGTKVFLRDADALFCGRGVQSAASLRAQGLSEVDARRLADFVQIVSDLPDEGDDYWNGKPVTFAECSKQFGNVIAERPALRILEAYQDRIELEQTEDLVRARRCFGGQVQVIVRAGGQWVVRGDLSGFLHHVIPDPATGVCRNSCEPRFARLNGRVRHHPVNEGVEDGNPDAFINPMFRFAITGGTPQRDMQFRFVTQGGFDPLAIDIAATAEVQPQSIRWSPATNELAVADGSLEGLVLINLSSVSATRFFY